MDTKNTPPKWTSSDMFLIGYLELKGHPYTLKLTGRYVIGESELTPALLQLITEFNSDVSVPIASYISAYKKAWALLNDLKRGVGHAENNM